MGLGISSDDRSLFSKPSIFVHGRKYRLLNVIGQGGEATVYRCKDSNGKHHAVKAFYFMRFPPNQIAQRIDGFLKEARLLKNLSGRSPYFIHLVDYEYKQDDAVGYMIMELGNGSLRDYLQGAPLNPQTRITFWQQIVDILRVLEDSKVVHADLKPENLILVGDTLKVTDLGLAFGLPSARQVAQQPAVRGTIDYMAPEVFLRRTGLKSDVWSAGVILYEMAYGRPPYFGLLNRDQKVAAISAMTPIFFPPTEDLFLLDCVQKCLRFNPFARPNSIYLQLHPYTRDDF